MKQRFREEPHLPSNAKVESFDEIGVIVLAAGGSRRLEEPKQLLRLGQSSLIWRATNSAINSHCKVTVVVLGAHANICREEIAHLPVEIVHNPSWEIGLSSSIRVGLSALTGRYSDISSAILTTCDQPFVTPQLLREIAVAYRESGARIVACKYSGGFGIPALFDRSLFPDLLGLRGDSGAKNIIERSSKDCLAVLFAKASEDIDTIDDYQRALRFHHKAELSR